MRSYHDPHAALSQIEKMHDRWMSVQRSTVSVVVRMMLAAKVDQPQTRAMEHRRRVTRDHEVDLEHNKRPSKVIR